MKKFFPKFIVFFIIFSALFSPFLTTPKTARAAVATWELNPAVTVSLLDIAYDTAYTTYELIPDLIQNQAQQQVQKQVKEGSSAPEPGGLYSGLGIRSGYTYGIESVAASALSFDALVKAAVHTMIQSVLNSTKQWAASGFRGQPSFVQNWRTTVRDAAIDATATIIDQLPPNMQDLLCTPQAFSGPRIFFDIGLGGNQTYSTSLDNTTYGCTFQDVANSFGRTMDSFSNNWGNGGMAMALEISNPKNNFYGAYAIINDEKIQRAAEYQQAKVNDAANTGFQSLTDGVLGQDCINSLDTGEEICTSRTPGNFVAQSINDTNLGPFQNMIDMEEISDVVNSLITGIFSSLLTPVVNNLNTGVVNVMQQVRF